MESLTGVSVSAFIGLTLIVAGFCAYMTGQALAGTWRPQWQIVPYMLLLGAADRFLTFALFEGPLLSFQGYVIDTAVLFVISLLAHRKTRAAKMVAQYPWQYTRTGLFSWAEIKS